MLTEERAQRLSLPKAHAIGIPPLVILSPGPRLCLKDCNRVFQLTQGVGVGIVPFGVKDAGRRKELCACQAATAAGEGEGVAIIRQLPACVEGPSKHPWLMIREDRFKPQL